MQAVSATVYEVLFVWGRLYKKVINIKLTMISGNVNQSEPRISYLDYVHTMPVRKTAV